MDGAYGASRGVYLRGVADIDRSTDALSASIASVVARFETMVKSVGARHGLAGGDVHEVMQDVRIRLWNAARRGERIEQFTTSYIYRAAISAALDLLRRRRGGPAETVEVDAVQATLPSPARTPEAQLLDAELQSRILAAVDSLPDPRRAAVRLYLSGYEAAEITRLMGWTEGKTRNLLSRGLANLRERLRQDGITGFGDR